MKGNFDNLNNTDKNAESIDLLDKNTGCAIQVTSTKNLHKIKQTLQKLEASKYSDKVKKIYVYIFTTKQRSYSNDAIRKSLNKDIDFDAKEHIIDNRDIYRIIQACVDIDIISDIENLLRKNFSELYLSETRTELKLEVFKTQYKEICLDNFSRLNFFGISLQQKPGELDLNQLFVKPRFTTSKKSSYLNEVKRVNNSQYDHYALDFLGFETYQDIDFKELFSIARHIALLGNPGAGKSSIIKYTICKILDQDLTIFSNQKIFEAIPFRIEVHKYSQFKNENKGGIVAYLNTLLTNDYQLQISSDNLSKIFKDDDTIIFFDGLDEVFDIQNRISVRNDIENFVKSYIKVRCIVSSRAESYSEVKMNYKTFVELEICNYNDQQVEEHVTKWYQLNERELKVRKEEISNCIKQLTYVDQDLKRNPLLLSLILMLYRNELEIPTSKLEIYENCVQTIVDYRDKKEKKLPTNLIISNPIGIFPALAYWHFINQNKEFRADDARQFVKNHLMKRGEIVDDLEASNASKEFFDFARVRSIYFDNEFTHKTFLEYFTAYYIYNDFYLKSDFQYHFEAILTNKLSESSWNVVLELVICKIDSNQIDFEVIDKIIEKQLAENGMRAKYFFLNILHYIKNISPKMRDILITEGFSICINLNNRKKDRELIYAFSESLVLLSKLESFKKHIENCFYNLINLQADCNEEALIFAYEARLYNPKLDLTKGLTYDATNKYSAYLHFLRDYHPEQHPDKYFDQIDKLLRYSSPSKQRTFIFWSRYGFPIFRGLKRIDVLIEYFTDPKNEDAEKSCMTLLNLGMSYDELEDFIIRNGGRKN